MLSDDVERLNKQILDDFLPAFRTNIMNAGKYNLNFDCEVDARFYYSSLTIKKNHNIVDKSKFIVDVLNDFLFDDLMKIERQHPEACVDFWVYTDNYIDNTFDVICLYCISDRKEGDLWQTK